ncbi:hypothetical protein Q3G72_004263 [Acer saccharum]|nr:hypothetical protein Q3G72_004263 [Acer saccharum]
MNQEFCNNNNNRENEYKILWGFPWQLNRGGDHRNLVDVLILGDYVTEAATSRVLEGNAGGLGVENAVDVVTILELVIKSYEDFDGFGRIIVCSWRSRSVTPRPEEDLTFSGVGCAPPSFLSWKRSRDEEGDELDV